MHYEFTGKTPTGPCAQLGAENAYPCADTGVSWTATMDEDFLYVTVKNSKGKQVKVEIEPCRTWPALFFAISPELKLNWNNFFHHKVYEPTVTVGDNEITVGVPREILNGYHKPGYPMRINVSADGKGWVERNPWPTRLYQDDNNPASLGWLMM